MTDYEPLTPVDIERMMGETLGLVESRIVAAKDARQAAKDRKREHTVNLASHRQEDTEKPTARADREDRAIMAHQESWLAMDTADVVAVHAQDLVEFAEKKLSTLQTAAKLVLQAYNVGGR